MNFREIERKVNECKVISVDIFDTLIFRLCQKPDRVFNLVAKKNNIDVKKFHNNRINAEEKARRLNKNEINIDDIYKCLSSEYSDIKTQLLKSEVETEISVSFPNIEILDFIRKYKGKKRIILVSDMYLNNEQICQILDSCGIKDYDKIYVSSDYGATKSEGSLFDIVIQNEKIAYRDMLHIGDNYKSDNFVPKRKGILAFQYKREHTDSNRMDFNILLQRKINSTNSYYNFGYYYLGPAIYGYVMWIQEQLLTKKIDKVFFFSREGQFIKKAFDLIKTKDFDEKYLYVSRRSLTVPAISYASSIDEFMKLRPIYGRVKVKDQFPKLGLSESVFKKYCWYKDNRNKIFAEIPDETRSQIIEDMFVESKTEAKTEMNSLVKYLEQEEVFGRFAVVDLGWNGSMQRALQVVLNVNNIDNEMLGFFLAQRDEYYKNMDFIENYGFLFDYGKVSDDENILLNSGTNLLEVLFSADHGTTLKYDIKNKKAVPVLADFEYSNEINNIRECQDAALEFVRGFSKEKPCNITLKKYFYNMYMLFLNPTKEVIDLFGDMAYSDLNEKNMRLSPKTSLLNIKKWCSNFVYSGWKVAYLKRNIPLKMKMHFLYIKF